MRADDGEQVEKVLEEGLRKAQQALQVLASETRMEPYVVSPANEAAARREFASDANRDALSALAFPAQSRRIVDERATRIAAAISTLVAGMAYRIAHSPLAREVPDDEMEAYRDLIRALSEAPDASRGSTHAAGVPESPNAV